MGGNGGRTCWKSGGSTPGAAPVSGAEGLAELELGWATQAHPGKLGGASTPAPHRQPNPSSLTNFNESIGDGDLNWQTLDDDMCVVGGAPG